MKCTLLDKAGRRNNRSHDLVGKRFGKLLVLKEMPERRNFRIMWLCHCDCGNKNIIIGSSLVCGLSKSCGCGVRESNISRCTTHGMTKTPEFKAWQQMITRCTNKNGPGFKNYGGRGISVCARWKKSFEAFLADVGPRPSHRHSIERKNTNSNYTPRNCYWATRVEQNRNTRRSRIWIVNGTKYASINEAAIAENVSYNSIYNWCRRHKKPNCSSPLRYGH